MILYVMHVDLSDSYLFPISAPFEDDEISIASPRGDFPARCGYDKRPTTSDNDEVWYVRHTKPEP